MSTSTEFDNTLTRVTLGGSSADMLDKINAPLAQTEAALNTLASRIAQLTGKSAIVRQYAPLASSINVGDLVYFDKTSQKYDKALAVTMGVPGANGADIEADSSHVEGLVIERIEDTVGTSNVLGTVLLGGYWEGPSSIIQSVTGLTTPTSGYYYLSGTSSGKAVQIAAGEPFNYVRQPVFMYHGLTTDSPARAMITMTMFYLAHDNHFHGSATLDNTNWKAADATHVQPSSLSGTWEWYDRSADSNLDNAGGMSNTVTVFFENGLLKGLDAFYVDEDGLIWRKTTTAAKGVIVVFNHYPFAYGASVVRAVESADDSALRVVNRNGVVRLIPNDFTGGATAPSATALSNISGNVKSFTPVVSKVTAGSGTTVTPDGTTAGGVVVSLKQNIGNHIDATVLNYNGTNMASDGIFVYTAFPAGRICSVAASLHVDFGNYEGEATIKASIYGLGSGTLSADMYWVPDSATELPDTAEVTGQSISFSGDEVSSIVPQTSAGFTLSEAESGTVVAVIKKTSTGSGTDTRLWRIGFMVELPTEEE